METTFKVIKNEKGNLTLLVKPVQFFFTDYLYKAYENNGKKNHFASGNIVIPYKELFVHLKEVVAKLNEVKKANQEPYAIDDIFSLEEDAYTLYKPSFNQDGERRENTYQIALSNRKDKDFLLSGNPSENAPIGKDIAQDYVYAVEVELVAGFNTEEEENRVFAVFHRAFACGKSNAQTKQNDDAWDGFDLSTDQEDLPF